MAQLWHPYMTTGETIALTIGTFVGKVMSLLFNMLYRFVIAFLPGSKCLLISWLQSPSTVILEPQKIKSVTFSTVSPSICHEVMGLDVKILVFWMLAFKPTFSTYRLYKNLIDCIKAASEIDRKTEVCSVLSSMGIIFPKMKESVTWVTGYERERKMN